MQAFEEELISVSRERDSYQLKFVSAETALEEAKKQKKQLEDLTQKLAEANNTIELQKHEITALKVRKFLRHAYLFKIFLIDIIITLNEYLSLNFSFHLIKYLLI